jgi:hypothetical protein
MTRDVRGLAMPLASNSAAHAAWMDANKLLGWGASTVLNTSVYGTQPIAMYVVDSTTPGCEWQYMDDVAARGDHEDWVDTYCQGRIPMPLWATPAEVGDQGMAIYDLGNGIMREYFLVNPVDGKPGHWTCNTGGFSLAKPGLVDLHLTNPGLQLRAGSNAVVSMHNSLGFIGIAEVFAGRIGHAVAFTCSNMGEGFSWPARQGDGSSTDPNAPVEGQWCRLPAAVDPDHNPATGEPYHPLTRMLIDAFKRHGGFASDKNLFVHAFNAEDGRTWRSLYGTDPWYRHPTDSSGASDGVCLKVLGNQNRAIDVSDFPWHLTEWAPRGWGRPRPDFWLPKGQIDPWW